MRISSSRKILGSIAAMSVVLAGSSASAETMPLSTLIALCQTRSNETAQADRNYCAGYIAGIIEGHTAAAALTHRSEPFCAPAQGIPGKEAIDIVLRYAAANAKMLEQPAYSGVTLAMVLSFPCPRRE